MMWLKARKLYITPMNREESVKTKTRLQVAIGGALLRQPFCLRRNQKRISVDDVA
jgi:hypothetical protein